MRRQAGIDVLRGFAAVGIIGCHLGLQPNTEAAKLLLRFTDFNVGLFGVIAGWFLFSSLTFEEFDAREIILRKTKRLLTPYFCWSALYIIASPIFNLLCRKPLINPKFYDWCYWFKIVFAGQAALHLWFLIHLFYCTVALAILYMNGFKLKPVLTYCLSVALIIISGLCGGNEFTYYAVRLYSFVFLGGALYLSKDLFEITHPRMWAILSIILSIMHISCRIGSRFWHDWLLSIPVFLFFHSLKLPNNYFSRFCADHSFSVYLIHPLICAGIAVVAQKIFATPYSATATLCVWIVDTFLAVIASCVLKIVSKLYYAK